MYILLSIEITEDLRGKILPVVDRQQAKVGTVHYIGKGLDLGELRCDVLSHLTDASSVAGKSRGKGSLQRPR